MFRGRYMHTIDAKGRVSLPAELRMELQRRSEHAPFLTNMPDHLALYPHEDWLAYEEQLFAPDPFMPEAQDLQLFMLSGAAPCAADNQGRILIPPATGAPCAAWRAGPCALCGAAPSAGTPRGAASRPRPASASSRR